MSFNQRPRVLLLIPHLFGGGAERVVALLAEGLSQEKYEIHVGLIAQKTPVEHTLPPWVTVHSLGAARVRSSALGLIRLVRHLRPKLILSGMFHLNFLVLLLRPFFRSRIRVLVRQNGTASAALASGSLPRYTRTFYRLLYRRAERIICQTPAMARDLSCSFAVPSDRLAILPNPIDIDGIRATVKSHMDGEVDPGTHLLAVGRLSEEKGFDMLLEAFALVREQLPNATLLIAGTGPEEPALKSQRLLLGLNQGVSFPGHIANPENCFAGSTLFVLSSRHEGLPNALLEAAAGGLPIVALPCSQGLVDLLKGQLGVWLAAEVSAAALAESLLTALKSLQPGQRFTHTFIDGFRKDRAIQAYEALIDAVLVGV